MKVFYNKKKLDWKTRCTVKRITQYSKNTFKCPKVQYPLKNVGYNILQHPFVTALVYKMYLIEHK